MKVYSIEVMDKRTQTSNDTGVTFTDIHEALYETALEWLHLTREERAKSIVRCVWYDEEAAERGEIESGCNMELQTNKQGDELYFPDVADDGHDIDKWFGNQMPHVAPESDWRDLHEEWHEGDEDAPEFEDEYHVAWANELVEYESFDVEDDADE